MQRRLILFLSVITGGVVLLNYSLPQSQAEHVSFKGNIHNIRSISSSDILFDDLIFLKEELKNNKIIVLGEALHSDGSAFLAKTRLIKFLHKELGYEVLAFEAGVYDMWRLNGLSPQDPGQALYQFWADSKQMKDLWSYVGDHHISLAGFDVQCSGNLTDSLRRELLFDYLQKFEPNAPARWSRYYEAASRLRRYLYPSGMSREKLAAVFSDLDSISHFLSRIPDSQENSAWYSFVTGLRPWWECVNQFRVGDNRRFHIRDSLMAKNIISLASRQEYASKKIILWMSNMHAFYDNKEIPEFRFTNVGQRIKEHFGASLYTILFTSYCRCDGDNEGVYELSRYNSLESTLHAEQTPYLYMNRIAKEDNAITSRVNQGASFLLNLGAMTDGLFFIDTMHNVKYH